jgi:large subunit ribosomal protein L15
MELNSLQRSGKRPYRRVGRGQGSTRGKQSGRGGKGQTARAGHKVRPEMRDIIKKLPKRRGYGKNRGRTVIPGLRARAISLTKIDALFAAGDVTREMLLDMNLAKKSQPITIVQGVTSKKFTFKGVRVTGSAKAAVEKAGGSVATK